MEALQRRTWVWTARRQTLPGAFPLTVVAAVSGYWVPSSESLGEAAVISTQDSLGCRPSWAGHSVLSSTLSGSSHWMEALSEGRILADRYSSLSRRGPLHGERGWGTDRLEAAGKSSEAPCPLFPSFLSLGSLRVPVQGSRLKGSQLGGRSPGFESKEQFESRGHPLDRLHRTVISLTVKQN